MNIFAIGLKILCLRQHTSKSLAACDKLPHLGIGNAKDENSCEGS